MAYESVNGAWPEGTNNGFDIVPTEREAKLVCKRLYRLIVGRPFRGKVEITKGNRYTTIRSGVLYVNPNYRNHGGWHELVHTFSHYLAWRQFSHLKSYSGHGHHHAFVEKQMIEYVVNNGYLEGKHKGKEKVIVPVQEKRYARVLAALEKKESALRRLEKQIKKLRIKRKYYEKTLEK